MTDAAVVRRVLAGDVEAFAILVDRYHDRYARYAVRMLGNREDAEEALQDAFVKAFRSLERYEERERFAAWLYRILVNQCRNVLASRNREAAAFPDLDPDSVDPASVGPAASPDAEALEAARDRLDELLATLPTAQREALLLRYAEDMSFDEMAAVTGAGISALKMRVRRALDRLRELILEQPHVLL